MADQAQRQDEPTFLFWLAIYRALRSICEAIKKRYLCKDEQKNE